ncbi:MAG: hypothetical protein M1457_00025 [bacterium]|nr:hypothetical protein [bacterium]
MQQVFLADENPLCRLAAQLPEGMRVCNRGCGIPNPAAWGHVCPFGMIMRRVVGPAGARQHRWIGRRFPNIGAMHQTLDRFLQAGMNEAMFIAHLPSNPIASEEELTRAARRVEAAAPEDAAPAAAGIVGPMVGGPIEEPDDQLSNVLEYIDQVQSIISGGEKHEAICERFLRVMGGIVPFEEMSIYLCDRKSGDLVIAASVEHQAARIEYPRARTCRLDTTSLGTAALAQRKILIQRGDTIEPLVGRFDGLGAIAIPLPMKAGEGIGVWISTRNAACPSRLGSDPVRVMGLLAELLAVRLRRGGPEPAPGRERAADPPTPTPERPSIRNAPPAWSDKSLALALAPEAARASRTKTGLALVRLKIVRLTGDGRRVAIPVEQLTEGMRSVLRPYDRFELAGGRFPLWDAILPEADVMVARTVADRLITVAEDVMDAHGGTEEQDLRIGAGISIWRVDAATPEQMIEHASEALDRALRQNGDALIQVYVSGETNPA